MAAAPARLVCATLVAASWLATLCVLPVHAATFALPSDGSTVVGRVRVVTGTGKNTLLDIARRHGLGYEDIVAANRGTSVWLPPDEARIVVPTEHVLPAKPWVGIVINLPQRRLYYFPHARPGETAHVMTFPLGIARPGWPTPLGRTSIVAKHRDPAWLVPLSIANERRREGEPRLPTYVPPGPDNPMGMLAMQTGFRSIFIHATNKPWSIGTPTSHGCLRLYPEDAALLFPRLPVGTPVRIINQPYVAGVRGGQLYMATFEPIADYPAAESRLTHAVAAVSRTLEDAADPRLRSKVNWDRVLAVARAEPQVVPVRLTASGGPFNEAVATLPAEPYPYAPYGEDANDARPPAARR